MNSKLPPLELEEEVDQYQAFQETTEVELDRCEHFDVTVKDNTLRCQTCGAGWSGGNIHALYQAFKNR